MAEVYVKQEIAENRKRAVSQLVEDEHDFEEESEDFEEEDDHNNDNNEGDSDDNDDFNSSQFSCSLCSCSFVTKASLLRHMVFHEGEQIYNCSFCHKNFAKNEDLSSHISKEHGGAKFHCPYCGRNISRRDHLQRHIRNVHPEKLAEINDENATNNDSDSKTVVSPILQKRLPTLPRINNFLDTNPRPAKIIKTELEEEIKSPGIPTMPTMIKMINKEHYENNLKEKESEPEYDNDEEEDEEENESYEKLNFGNYGQDEEDDDEEQDPLLICQQEIQEEPEDESYEYEMATITPTVIYGNGNQNGNINNTINNNNNNNNNDKINKINASLNGIRVERKFQCQECGASFMNKMNLQRHLMTHSSNRPHKCPMCNKGFVRKEHLTKHLSSVHSGMKFICEICKKDISRKDHLIRHIRNVHPTEYLGIPPELAQTKNLDLPISALQAQGLKLSEKALLSMQPKPKKPYLNCDMCEDTFTHINDLHLHQSTKHADIRRFKCNFCPKAFKRKEHLMKHEVLHTGEKNFSCNQCGKEFPRKDALQDHTRRIHGSDHNLSGVEYPCNFCDKIFLQRSNLLRHLKNLHQLVVNVPQQNLLLPSSSFPSFLPATAAPSSSKTSMKSLNNNNNLPKNNSRFNNGNGTVHNVSTSDLQSLLKMRNIMNMNNNNLPLSSNSHSHTQSNSSFDFSNISPMSLLNVNMMVEGESDNDEEEQEEEEEIEEAGDIFLCPVCNNTFNNEIIFRVHLNSHGQFK